MSHRAPPRGRATESLVREAALTLSAQCGYHRTALCDIAGEVGIRTPSLCNHICGKRSQPVPELIRELPPR
jgi:hypothetical protein